MTAQKLINKGKQVFCVLSDPHRAMGKKGGDIKEVKQPDHKKLELFERQIRGAVKLTIHEHESDLHLITKLIREGKFPCESLKYF